MYQGFKSLSSICLLRQPDFRKSPVIMSAWSIIGFGTDAPSFRLLSILCACGLVKPLKFQQVIGGLVIGGFPFNGNPARFDPTTANIGLGGRDVLKPLHKGLGWARRGACGGNRGYQWFQHGSPHKKISRVTDTIKIKAHTRSSFVGACARVGESRSTCRAMAAVMSWFTLSKIYRDCMGLTPVMRP